MEALSRIAIGVPGQSGGIVQVPLAEVAGIGLATGAFYIYREQQERYIPVKFSVRGRDLGGAVLRPAKVADQVQLPSGYRRLGGDFANFRVPSPGWRSPCRWRSRSSSCCSMSASARSSTP
jgi:cobalt-zinc-cadmium resistance protein CzcA